MESEAATSNEVEVDAIHSLKIKPYLAEKVNSFRLVVLKNCLSEWVSHTMNNKILESVSDLSLEVSDNDLLHYHREIEMRFSSKEELFLAD